MRIGFPAGYNSPPPRFFASESLNTWASKRDRFSVPRRVWEAGIRQQSRENYIANAREILMEPLLESKTNVLFWRYLFEWVILSRTLKWKKNLLV